MAHPHQGEEDRRPPPLGLRGLSRVAFQSRSPAPGGLPPLGLAGRGPLPSFSIGTAAFERVAAGPSTFPRRRVGLPRPSRPPAPNEAGSSNWATSIGGGSGSAGSARSSFVGFSLANGSGGISFGGGGGISFGGGGSESLGFTFSTGTGGNRREGSSHGGSTEGIGGNEGTIGYRGVGYNPNFDHADEYPPSQEHVQTQKEPLDLNVMSNKETRTQYRTDEKRHIYSEILARNGRGNRLRGAWELKPADKVDREKSREYLVKYVLPAIKEKWPESDRWNTIYIQQDNAKTHIKPDDPLFLQEAARGGWDIRMIYQPPNSPDTNILDLGWFASIQAMFHRKMPKTLPEIVQKVNQSLAEYPHQRLNRIWLSHQACMREIIKRKGSIHYAVPHLKKKALERQGLLPVRLTIDREYVEQAIEYLNST
ncbi:hypothetical protein ACQ4PT_038204 [Festuca glaucescens]